MALPLHAMFKLKWFETSPCRKVRSTWRKLQKGSPAFICYVPASPMCLNPLCACILYMPASPMCLHPLCACIPYVPSIWTPSRLIPFSSCWCQNICLLVPLLSSSTVVWLHTQELHRGLSAPCHGRESGSSGLTLSEDLSTDKWRERGRGERENKSMEVK